MGMPPMMGPQGYGYPPMGMMPMGMGIMPMPPQMNNANNADKKNKLVPQEIPKKEDKQDEKPPVTTVFVGNISDRAPDAMIRQMLQRCGNVLSWKRVQGASGKLQAFGFCEYESPEATLRAIRLLHNWMIPDKRLVVKVDAKTKALLDEWGRKKKKKESDDDKKKEDGEIVEDKDSTSPDELDEFTLREDRVAKAGLDAIMREYAADIERELPPGEEEPPKEEKPKRKKEKLSDGPKDAVSKRNLGLEDMELEEEKKEIINREIRSFRDAYKMCW